LLATVVGNAPNNKVAFPPTGGDFSNIADDPGTGDSGDNSGGGDNGPGEMDQN
jgi:hypothetical protein